MLFYVFLGILGVIIDPILSLDPKEGKTTNQPPTIQPTTFQPPSNHLPATNQQHRKVVQWHGRPCSCGEPRWRQRREQRLRSLGFGELCLGIYDYGSGALGDRISLVYFSFYQSVFLGYPVFRNYPVFSTIRKDLRVS